MLRVLVCFVAALLSGVSAFAQGNGTLQIHYMDVGQGDAAVLISPLGEIVLFDDGVLNQCGKPLAYLHSLGITKIDYHIASHYHSDHIGCAQAILGMFPLQKVAYDRGGSYTTATFTNYVNAVGAKRTTAMKGQTLTLDAGSGTPVTITFVALNGNGVPSADENDLSLVSVVRFGQFDAEFGGDLSGAGTGVPDPDPSACSYSVSPTSVTLPSTGGSFSVSVTAATGCSWTASTTSPWVSSASAVGSGTGTVLFSAAANASLARSATCVVAGQTVSINQAGTAAGSNTCARPAGTPVSATAICRDGTYSSSQNRSGTCSSHGGVSCWLCPGALCNGIVGYPEPPDNHPASYADIESGVASLVGRVEVYKVHHHASASSSNASWLSVTSPKVGIISVGNANTYGHPTSAALSRLHNAGVKTYWTSPGNGAAPTSGQDVIAGSVVVSVNPNATTFRVTYAGVTEAFSDWGYGAPPAVALPFGSLDTPAPAARVTGEVAVTGWALDDSGVAGVDIYRSPVPGEPVAANGMVFVGAATLVDGARPDVAAAYPSYPSVTAAGWGYMLLSNMLPNGGNGTFTISAYVRAIDGEAALLGSRAIIVENAVARKPFGTIDTPAQGQVVSGTILNFGWALTPQPNNIPVDGSTIVVFVDNAPIGHPVYNNARNDIVSLFPGYANTDGAVGYFVLDTRTLPNGVHSIAWGVRDSAGNVSGIGSRFFTVMNP